VTMPSTLGRLGDVAEPHFAGSQLARHSAE